MNSALDKILGVAAKIKTPLTLSGMIVSILYLLYKQILSLDIFENVGAISTFAIIQNILDRLFWLAILAMILGVASYLTTFIVNRRASNSSSNVSLIDASLDPKDSPYDQTSENGKKRIKPKAKATNAGGHKK